MCRSWGNEETVTVVYTESEARDLHALLMRASSLKRKMYTALQQLEAKREEANRYRNWSA